MFTKQQWITTAQSTKTRRPCAQWGSVWARKPDPEAGDQLYFF